MKTKLLKKLRRRALQKIKFVELPTYVVIAKVEGSIIYDHYESYTLDEFKSFSTNRLKYDLCSARRKYILKLVKDIRNSSQSKLVEKKVKQLNSIR